MRIPNGVPSMGSRLAEASGTEAIPTQAQWRALELVASGQDSSALEHGRNIVVAKSLLRRGWVAWRPTQPKPITGALRLTSMGRAALQRGRQVHSPQGEQP